MISREGNHHLACHEGYSHTKSQRFDEFGNVKGKFLYLDVYKAPFINEQGEMIGTVGLWARCYRDTKFADSTHAGPEDGGDRNISGGDCP